MPTLSVRAAVEVLSVSNNTLHSEVDVTLIIHSNKLMRNEHNYKFIKIHLN
jgi:hypothetical protein